MATKPIRIQPLPDEEFGEEERELMAERFGNYKGPLHNVIRVFLRHPRALKAYNTLAVNVSSPENELSQREQEIIVLRTAWNIRSFYVYSRHRTYGQRLGLSIEEIEALKFDVHAGQWNERETLLIEIIDALSTKFDVPPQVMARAEKIFTEVEVMEMILACGHYRIVGMLINVADPELDEDLKTPDREVRLAR